MEASKIFNGDSLMTEVLLKNEPITSTSEVLDAIWVPSSQGSVPMVNFERENNTAKAYTTQLDCKLENCIDDSADGSFHPPEKKRRLSLNQVKFLEKSFDVDNKLEPDRKVQLAKDLGLQPRQVAIWFQNRRARYKTKVLERDYDSLKASYDKMKADFDALSSENEKLRNEIHLLGQKLLSRDNDESKPEPESEPWDPISPLDFRVREHLLSSKDVLPMVACKQEDAASSSKSDVFDSDSPNYCNDGNHSGTLEPADSSHVDNSDFSHDDDEPPCFPKFEFDYLQPNSCNLGFPVQDQGTWLWQY